MVINTGFVFGLEIIEVESNPEGSDSGNEWVELYSEDEVSLDGYFLENADQDVLNLSGNFSGFFVIEFETQWLDNGDEAVYLKDSSGIISETPLLDDSDNDDRTWQKCDSEGDWIFRDGTKDGENNCDEEPNNSGSGQGNSNEQENPDNNDDIEVIENNINNDSETQSIQNLNNINHEKNEKIVLNVIEEDNGLDDSSDVEMTWVSKQEKVRKGVLYSFFVFMIVLIVLLAWRKL